MHKIYNTDGTYKEYSDDQVKIITVENIKEFENYKNGVNFYLKDGSVHFIANATVGKDGQSVTFNN